MEKTIEITEDYVSFETAKLLKEKGFDERCFSFYWPDGSLDANSHDKTTNLRNSTASNPVAPTLQMAMKWLREVHNIFFNVNYFHIDVGNKWADLAIWLPYKNGCEFSIGGFDIETICEAAIKYCLENLI